MKKRYIRICAAVLSAVCLSAAAAGAALAAGPGSGGPGASGPGSAYSGGPGAPGPGLAYSGGPGQSLSQAVSYDIPAPEGELRGVWISYLIWDQMPADQAGFKRKVNEILDNCKAWGMNAVFVHVRSHGDAMYPSSIYPWSKFAGGTDGSGVQGRSPGYDPLAYFIQAAHERGLQFHAWFNPYRITGYLMNWSEVSSISPAKRWAFDGDPSNDRNVLYHDGAYYFNPASEQVRQMVIEGVMEVVRGYDVDGIHFDDYFYPELDDTVEGRQFDRPEYLASGSRQPISQWRRDQVSDLVGRVYQAIKAEKPQVVFGISPQGYVDHLRSDEKLFVDIDRWMSEPGYIDYVMPQLYWGFETKTSSGAPAPYAFAANLNTWRNLKAKGNVTLYLGLAMYRAGVDVTDYNDVSEWLRRDDILARQVAAGRSAGDVSGYCFYSYDSFLQPEAAGEVKNLLPLLRQ